MKFLVYFACLALAAADFPAYQTHHEGKRNHMSYNYNYNPSLTHHQQHDYNQKEQQYSMYGQHHQQQYPQYEEMHKPESYPSDMLPHYPGGQNQGPHQQYMHGEQMPHGQYNHHQQQYQYGQKHNHGQVVSNHQYKHTQQHYGQQNHKQYKRSVYAPVIHDYYPETPLSFYDTLY